MSFFSFLPHRLYHTIEVYHTQKKGTTSGLSQRLFIWCCRNDNPLQYEMNGCFLKRTLGGEFKKTVHYYGHSLFIFYYHIMKLVSKGNGKNFYGFENGEIIEIVKLRGAFYRTKYVIGEGLRPIGDALKKSEFTLVD